MRNRSVTTLIEAQGEASLGVKSYNLISDASMKREKFLSTLTLEDKNLRFLVVHVIWH